MRPGSSVFRLTLAHRSSAHSLWHAHVPPERCHASSIWVQAVFMQACQICGAGTGGASIYDRILHCKAALVQPRAPAVRFCCVSTSFLASEERHSE